MTVSDIKLHKCIDSLKYQTTYKKLLKACRAKTYENMAKMRFRLEKIKI
jgi:hypothetical protein